MKETFLKKGLFYFLSLFLVTSLVIGFVYLSIQQSYRQTANDPQIQIVEDTVSRLQEGQNPQALIPSEKVDLAKSLAPFFIIYDLEGKILFSNATINNGEPSLPNGVFDSAKESERRFTWQPLQGVRIAAVIQKFSNNKERGFVLSGRNLREVENRQAQLSLFALLAWLASSLLVVLLFLFSNSLKLK